MTQLIQKFSLLRRREDFTKEQFQKYWREEHGPLLASIPAYWKNNSSYVQSRALPLPASIGTESPFDGIAQTMQRPRENLQRGFFDEPEYMDIVRPDELKFLSVPECTAVFGRQHVIKDGPPTGVKFISFLRRVDGMELDPFLDYWRNKHALLVEDVKPFWNHIRRYVQNHGIPEWSRGLALDGKVAPFSGVAEIWFDSPEAVEQAFNEPEYLERVRPDEGRFIAKPTTRFLVEEYEVKMPAGMRY